MGQRRIDSGETAALALAVLLAYANSLAGVFQFDDFLVIVNEPVVHDWQSWLADLGHGIRPLLKLSYLLNWLSSWGGPSFHGLNILIHFGNALLVLLLARCFFASPAVRQPGHPHARHIPLLAALLFAVHPVHTEAVTYICGRSCSLMALFYLAGLLAHAAEGRNSRLRRLAVVPLLFAAAIGCKETAITFPLALLVWDVLSGCTLRQIILRQWLVWLLAALIAATLVSHPVYQVMLINCAGLRSLRTNALTTANAFFYLLGKWLWPVHLNIDPDLPVVRDAGSLLPQSLGLIVLIATAWWGRGRRPWLALAIFWLLLHLVPLYLFAPRQDIANERQLYLAGLPLFIAVAAEISLWPRHWRLAAAGLLLLLTMLTIARNSVYRSEISLWENTVALSPGKARAHNNLGYAFMLAHRDDEARKEYLAALGIDPGFTMARNNLAALQENLKAPGSGR